MPSIITHSVVAIATGKTVTNEKMPIRFWLYAVACSCLPDADVIAFGFGIPYGHFFGHRGFFHSLFFALLLSLVALALFHSAQKCSPRQWLMVWACFFISAASHGILDAFTNGGLGIALLSPLDDTRFFFPTAPIKVSPIGISAFFTKRGFHVLMSEIIWVWVPCVIIVLMTRKIKVKFKSQITNSK
ncbi:MAG: metal-dependent hydrolase [Desulfobacterales bacterium]|nr:metal-dependent hydrolase [Desulfobacterales bacterium]